MNSWIDLRAVAEIVCVGLLAGAGLPALFALGMRILGTPARRHGRADLPEDRVVASGPAGIATAGAIFAVVLAAVGYGIYIIVKSGHGA